MKQGKVWSKNCPWFISCLQKSGLVDASEETACTPSNIATVDEKAFSTVFSAMGGIVCPFSIWMRYFWTCCFAPYYVVDTVLSICPPFNSTWMNVSLTLPATTGSVQATQGVRMTPSLSWTWAAAGNWQLWPSKTSRMHTIMTGKEALFLIEERTQNKPILLTKINIVPKT